MSQNQPDLEKRGVCHCGMPFLSFTTYDGKYTNQERFYCTVRHQRVAKLEEKMRQRKKAREANYRDLWEALGQMRLMEENENADC